MPQFANFRNMFFNYNNVILGLFVFSIGLFKKVYIADSFALWANAGFNAPQALTFLDAWMASLSYTFQLYYDFSGYSDMAIGCGLLFNIRLPMNFNSPYKATNIQDFWRRWHMTLSRWLRDYIYIPLGGNRLGPSKTYLNLFITFLIGEFGTEQIGPLLFGGLCMEQLYWFIGSGNLFISGYRHWRPGFALFYL